MISIEGFDRYKDAIDWTDSLGDVSMVSSEYEKEGRLSRSID
jgi:hypothetical protein